MDQAGGAAALGVVHHIDGAFLVVGAPAAPVDVVLEVAEDFLAGGQGAVVGGGGGGGHNVFPPARVALEGRLPRRGGVGKG